MTYKNLTEILQEQKSLLKEHEAISDKLNQLPEEYYKIFISQSPQFDVILGSETRDQIDDIVPCLLGNLGNVYTTTRKAYELSQFLKHENKLTSILKYKIKPLDVYWDEDKRIQTGKTLLKSKGKMIKCLGLCSSCYGEEYNAMSSIAEDLSKKGKVIEIYDLRSQKYNPNYKPVVFTPVDFEKHTRMDFEK
jgi:hypothetical protein